MANNKMLIDAAHPEETRVAMVRGNRVDEFDFESEHKTQLRGNIYLAKVTRVEPSLQAAFVDYGGNRHGFLAFSEIHPDYYQIPIADRQALLEAEAEDARVFAAEDDEEDDATAETASDADEAEEEQEAKPARKRRSRRRGPKKAAAADADGDETPDEPKDEAEEDKTKEDKAIEDKAIEDKTIEDKTIEDKTIEDRGEESDSDDSEMSADNDGDDVVSEPAEEPAKKPKRRTSRKKAEPEAETADSAEATEEAPAEEKPKRRRATKKAPAKKADAKEAVAEEATTESTGEPVEAEKKPKRRTSRKKAEPVEAVAEAPAEAETETVETAEEEKPAKKPRRRTSRKAKEADAEPEAAEEAAPAEQAEADSEATEEIAAKNTDNDKGGDKEEDEKESKPKSRTRSRSRSRRGKKDDSAKATPDDDDDSDSAPVEAIGSEDALEEVPARRRSNRRHYKIQEVIKRRQILLVQVVKEERGNKGAALTTYLSLAGRYSVLMPNTARGGGISRKITNSADRKRLKAVASELEVPEGMGVILRTAGASRASEEIERDFEYLMRLWENVRTLTLESTAPCLVYEEGSLIKRSIRDLYDKDTGEILVAGEDGYKEAKNFMGMLMPSHEKNVKLYKDRLPLFAKMGVEAQLDAMLQPQVTLKSGGYLIIDQTEALVAIDVNSGRSTRQHSIEETATQTNLEAADEVARQLRLRDLAGLIVIDFIDMEDRRNIRSVEKRLKDALKKDRARIQVGRISHFGLMEMSRQRIRASVLESTTQTCPVCEGLGHVRSSSSIVLSVLRAIEDHLNRNSRNNITVKISHATAMYMLNSKRESLSDLEERFGVVITIETVETLGTTPCIIEKGEVSNRRPAQTKAIQADTQSSDPIETDASDDTADASNQNGAAQNASGEGTEGEGQGRKKRRRRRRKKNNNSDEAQQAQAEGQEVSEPPQQAEDQPVDEPAPKKPRGRSKKSDDATPPPVEEVKAPEEAPAEDAEPPKGRRTTRRKATDPEPQATEEAAPVEAEPAEEGDTSKKGKRAGWWQRKFF